MCVFVYVCSQKDGKGDEDSTEYTQGESGGKVNIFEVIMSLIVRKNVRMDVCVILNVTELELYESSNTKAL